MFVRERRGRAPARDRVPVSAIERGSGVRDVVEWSKTTRGGSQYDLLALADESTSCSSLYGLCE
jgi:hypothetical protein